VAREALAGREAWLVGGTVRDRLLGAPEKADIDLIVPDDPEQAARAIARATRAPAFELSGEFGNWRVVGGRDDGEPWQIDVAALQGGSLEEDLARRDFTVNAMAEPLAGGGIVDPHGGREDLAARRLRMVSAEAFDSDPLRLIRLVRFACTLDLEPEPETLAAARARAARIDAVARERVFAELRQIIASDRVRDGIRLLDEIDLTSHVLPELAALRGVEQNRYHHLDVYEHTLAVLDAVVEIESDPGAPLEMPELSGPLREFLARPLADEMTRGTALRFGALLHDIAKPQTQARDEDGNVLGFPRHDVEGAKVSRAVLAGLRASERLRAHVEALARHHLRLGFLVHEMPLDRRDIYRYITATRPVEVDVSLLSVADRLATRGRKAEEAIARHMEAARAVLPAALRFEEEAGGPPLVRGDELARALGIKPGPELGRLLAAIDEARYVGEVATPDEAVALARRLLAADGGG